VHTISDFQMRLEIEVVAPSCVLQSLACAPNVHVYDYEWFRDKFWPKWSEYVRAVNAQIEEKPLLNSPVRGICDEITKEFATKLIQATRRARKDQDVGAGVKETSIIIPADYVLNRIPGYGPHRNALVWVTKDGGKTHKRLFVEPQLSYANYEDKELEIALRDGVVLCDAWL